MLTLGIETSCDETSCAVLRDRNELLSNIVSSSLMRHKPFGGVVPEIASRHCLEQIDGVYHEALRKARVRSGDLSLVAVTEGPGLIGSLLVGVSFAKALSYELGIPLVGVNHLEAHLAANFIGQPVPRTYLGLLVSGGHTHLTWHENGKTEVLGQTIDDAVGEAYDKTAKLLGLGYPGGPVIDRLAREGDERAFTFTLPRQKGTYDFSFSGIKTAVFYLVRKQPVITPGFQRDMAASFQHAVVSWLVEKTFRAVRDRKASCLVVGGGVSANSALRERLVEEGGEHGIEVRIPVLSLTNDNAAMIARRGLDLYDEGIRAPRTLSANPNLAHAISE